MVQFGVGQQMQETAGDGKMMKNVEFHKNDFTISDAFTSPSHQDQEPISQRHVQQILRKSTWLGKTITS